MFLRTLPIISVLVLALCQTGTSETTSGSPPTPSSSNHSTSELPSGDTDTVQTPLRTTPTNTTPTSETTSGSPPTPSSSNHSTSEVPSGDTGTDQTPLRTAPTNTTHTSENPAIATDKNNKNTAKYISDPTDTTISSSTKHSSNNSTTTISPLFKSTTDTRVSTTTTPSAAVDDEGNSSSTATPSTAGGDKDASQEQNIIRHNTSSAHESGITTESTMPTLSSEVETETDNDDIRCNPPSEDAVLPNLLVGGDDGVYWADTTPNRVLFRVHQQDLDAYSVDYHHEKKYLFFAALRNSIVRMNITTNNTYLADGAKLFKPNVTGDVQLAVDWVRHEVYWMSGAQRRIEKANVDEGPTTIIFQNKSSNFKYPRNLVIDPYERYLFFVDNDSVFKLNLNNQNPEEIIFSTHNISTVRCLALERHNKTLYFTGTDREDKPFVASSSYDGSDVRFYALGGGPWNDIFSLDVFRETLFFGHYAANELDTLYSTQLSTDSSVKKIYIPPKSENIIWGLKVYHSNVQSHDDIRTCLEADNV